MELEEILSDSESGLESEFDDLDLFSTNDEEDEENNIFQLQILEKDMLLENGVGLASFPRT